MNFVMNNQAFNFAQRWLKPVACGLFFIAQINASWAGIALDRTRMIITGDARSVSANLTNTSPSIPFLAQSWVEDAHGTKITSPLMVLPPLQRINGGQKGIARVTKTSGINALPQDRESLFYLNVREIPPKPDKPNVLQLAIRSRFKFIYRPAGLGNRDAAAEKLTLTASGSSLAINNPTPFYITVSRISRDGGKALNSKTVMLAPQSSQTVALSSAVNRGETLTVNNINDYGADVAVKVAVK